jgi:hypothetical protein
MGFDEGGVVFDEDDDEWGLISWEQVHMTAILDTNEILLIIQFK